MSDTDEIGISLRSRQYVDWRDLRFKSYDDPVMAEQVAALAAMIKLRMRELGQIIAASTQGMSSQMPDPIAKQISDLSYQSAQINDDGLKRILASINDALDNVAIEPKSTIPIKSRVRLRAPYKVFTSQFDEIIDGASFLVNDDSASEYIKLLTKTIDRVRTDYSKVVLTL